MKDWTKILSFDSLYEADIRNQLLQNSGIESVVINTKDSLFLIGSVDLYVNKADEKKALFVIEQFQGLTKINSFLLKKPIENLQNFLTNKGIETILKERDSDNYILENYELYIENEKTQDVVPYLTGEKLDGWSLVDTCSRTRQTRYRVELLETHKIETIVIKKRDSNFHTEEINIYVKSDFLAKAKEILEKLTDWTVVKTFNKFEVAELKEDILGKKGIRGIIKPNGNQFDLFVKTAKKEEAEDVLKATKEWIEIRRYANFTEAENALLNLEQNGVESSILTIQDSMFMIGGFALYIDKIKVTEAIDILTEFEGGKIIE